MQGHSEAGGGVHPGQVASRSNLCMKSVYTVNMLMDPRDYHYCYYYYNCCCCCCYYYTNAAVIITVH